MGGGKKIGIGDEAAGDSAGDRPMGLVDRWDPVGVPFLAESVACKPRQASSGEAFLSTGFGMRGGAQGTIKKRGLILTLGGGGEQ
jgi:hypothetical protein